MAHTYFEKSVQKIRDHVMIALLCKEYEKEGYQLTPEEVTLKNSWFRIANQRFRRPDLKEQSERILFRALEKLKETYF